MLLLRALGAASLTVPAGALLCMLIRCPPTHPLCTASMGQCVSTWDGMGCGVSQLFVSEFKVVIVLPSHPSAHGADGAPC